jgi:ketosteroid isomerase-like protein
MRVKFSAFLLAAAATLCVHVRSAAADEAVPDLLRRQTQELFDAISAGTPAVWERYLDPQVRYGDESGAVAGKKEMVEGVRPLPAGVSGTIRVTDFDAALHGDVAVATYVTDEQETFHGAKLHCRYRSVDTWKKTPDGWRLVAAQVLALREDPPAATLTAAARAEYAGRYALPDGLGYEIRANAKGDGLEGVQDGRKPEVLVAEAPDVLFVPGKPRYRYLMRRDTSGRVDALVQRREAWDLVWTKK